jgi:Putative DNA-binding domain
MTYDLVRLDLSNLDAGLVDHLVKVGEPLHIERKEVIPPPEPLSELMGSLGNTEGGWAIFGVRDADGALVGLPASRSDLQDEIRNAVRKTLDPLPNFTARRVSYQGVELGIVRVYRSDDTPLVSTHKGAIYVRLPGGKEPIGSRAQLDALIARGSSTARGDAEGRLQTLTVAATTLDAADLAGKSVSVEPVYREWVLSATPVGADPGFLDRLRSDAVRQAAEAAAKQLLPPGGGYQSQGWVETRPAPPGWASWAERVGDLQLAAVIVDPAGVLTTVVRTGRMRSVVNVDELVRETLVPMFTAVLDVLAAAGAPGRCACRLHGRGFGGVYLQAFPHGGVQVPSGTLASQAHVIVPSSSAAAPAAEQSTGATSAERLPVINIARSAAGRHGRLLRARTRSLSVTSRCSCRAPARAALAGSSCSSTSRRSVRAPPRRARRPVANVRALRPPDPAQALGDPALRPSGPSQTPGDPRPPGRGRPGRQNRHGHPVEIA